MIMSKCRLAAVQGTIGFLMRTRGALCALLLCALPSLGSAEARADIVEPVPLHRMAACKSMSEPEFVTVVAIHAEYLDEWNRTVTPRVSEAFEAWRAAAAPTRRLPTAVSARAAAAGFMEALRAASKSHLAFYESCCLVAQTEGLPSALLLDSVASRLVLWDLPDTSGALVGLPIECFVRVARGWCAAPSELNGSAAALEAWLPMMEQRARLLLALPEDFVEVYARAGLAPSTSVATLSDEDLALLRVAGREAFSTLEASLNAWRAESVSTAIAQASNLADQPIMERALVLCACHLASDPEVRELARRELAALAALAPQRSDAQLREKVALACLTHRRPAREWTLRVCAAPTDSGSESNGETPSAAAGWQIEWSTAVAALEALARGRSDQRDPMASAGQRAIEAWEAAMVQLAAPVRRTLEPNRDLVQWTADLLAVQGVARAKWKEPLENAAAQLQASAPSRSAATKLITATGAERGEPHAAAAEDIVEAVRVFPSELASALSRGAVIVRDTLAAAAVPLEDAEVMIRAWRCSALASIRINPTDPVELGAAAFVDAIEIGLRDGVPMATFQTPYWNEYSAQREATLFDLATASARVLSNLALDLAAADAGGERTQVERAADTDSLALRESHLQRLCVLNGTAIEHLRTLPEDAALRAACHIEAAAFPAVDAIRLVVEPPGAAPRDIARGQYPQLLERLRKSQAARCCAASKDARRAATAEMAAALGQLVHELDAEASAVQP